MNIHASRIASSAAFALFTIACSCAFAQRPSDPALLVPQAAPELDYVAVANPLTIPAGMVTGAPSSLAFDKAGHLWVLYRGAQAFAEFDADGRFIRAFGEGLFTRPHGLKFDGSGNMWATDDRGHVVYKGKSAGTDLVDAGSKRTARTDQPANRRRRRRQRRCIRRSRAYAGTQWRCARREVRQERDFHKVLGRKRQRSRTIRRCPRDRDRRQRTALGRRSRESANPDLRSGRELPEGIEVRRAAVFASNRRSIRSHGERIRRPGPAPRPRWQGDFRDWKGGQGT